MKVIEKITLLHTIKEKQREMIEIGLLKGLRSEETVQLSRELDVLLNEYQKLHVEKEEIIFAEL